MGVTQRRDNEERIDQYDMLGLEPYSLREAVMRLLLAAVFIPGCLLLNGCASFTREIRTAGWTDDVKPGPLLSAANIGEGLFVATMELDKNRKVNVQITESEATPGRKYTIGELTVGRFSPLIGSGFASRKDIYLKTDIVYNGRDLFAVDGDRYLIEWKCELIHPGHFRGLIFNISIYSTD